MPKSIPEVKIGNEVYELKDRTAREHLVEVSTTQPSDENNRLWIKDQEAEYEVPTIDEFNDLKSALGKQIDVIAGSYQSELWSDSYFSTFIPVVPGSTYYIKAGSSGSAPYSGLKSVTIPPTVGSSPVYSDASGWDERRSVAKNGSASGIIPDDVNYLYFYAGTTKSYTRLPISIIINGIEYIGDAFTGIDYLASENNQTRNAISTIQNEIVPNSNSVICKGRNDSGAWTDALTVNTQTALIPVNPGDIVTVIPSDDNTSSPIACIKEVTNYPPKNGDTIQLSSYSPWTETISVPRGGIFTGTIPADGKYLLSYFGNTSAHNRKPKSIKINGYDCILSVHGNIVEAVDEKKSIVPFDVPYYINESAWVYDDSGFSSYVIPVQSGDVVEVYAYGQNSSPIAILTAFPTVGVTVPFSSAEGYSSIVTLAKGTKLTVEMPNDAVYLYAYCGKPSNPRTPDAIFVNGINVLNNVPKMFDTYNNPFANIRANNVVSMSHAGHYDPDGTPSSSEAPANSLAAFKMAKEHGFTWIETDVHFTSNNVPVMCHDDKINSYARVPTGDPSNPEAALESTVKISEITYNQLLEYDFCVVHGQVKTQYVGNKITTFETLLNFAKCVGMNLSVEIKRDVTYTDEQLDLLIELTRKYGMSNNVEWRSAGQDPLLYISSHYPYANLAINADPSAQDSGAYNAVGLGRRLLTGHNYVAISMSNSVSATAQKYIVDSGFVFETSIVATAAGVAALSPYASRVTTNSIPIDQLLLEYGMSL